MRGCRLAESNGTIRCRGRLLPTGVVGLSLWPKQPRGLYLLPPGAPFIELLPLKEGAQEEAAPTILLPEAQQGKEYELVLTDHTSLTRSSPAQPPPPPGPLEPCRGPGHELMRPWA